MLRFSLVVPNTRYNDNYLWSVLPSRGLLSLAAVLRQDGYTVNYIDADIDNLSNIEIIKQLKVFNSDIVAITMNTFQAKAAIDLAKTIKQYDQDIIIIVGGPHPSALRKKLLIDYPWLDIACIGESEETIVELAKAIDNNEDLYNIRGITYRISNKIYETVDRPLIRDIDSIPFPAYDLACDLNRYPGAQPVLKPLSMHIMASRGCPFNCIFCTKSVWGNLVRFRNPQHIVDEVEFLHKKFGINEIFFQDDTMNLNRKWFFSVCDEIIKRKLHKEMVFKAPFRVNSKLLDEELLLKAKEAGFWIIFYGVESGNQKVLDTIKKDITIKEIKRAFELTHKAGIQTIAAFMVGNIGDTSETINNSVALAKEIKPSVFGFSIATPLPGTEFYEIAKERGWIYSEDFSNYSQFKAVSRNEALTMEEITILRYKADTEVRNYIDIIKKKDEMLFPIHDRYWTETADFIKVNIKAEDRLIAPIEFDEKFPSKTIPYATVFKKETDFQWALIHKGMMEEINYTLLKRIIQKYNPVFANEIFVVFSSYMELSEVNRGSSHYKSFEEKMRLKGNFKETLFGTLNNFKGQIVRFGLNKNNVIERTYTKTIAKHDSAVPNIDYSSLSVTEIKKLMDERYDTKQAYNIAYLWDKVRTNELNNHVIKLISPVNDKKILEIGCGIGGGADYINHCKEFFGTDLSDTAISQAIQAFGNRPNFRFISMDAMDLKFDNNYFDVVIAKEVIEHLPEPQKAIKEAFRVLKPNGLFVVTSPNRDSIHLRVNRMLGYSDFKCSSDHIREFTFQEAVEMLSKERFIIIDTSGVFLLPYWGIPGIDEHVRHLTDNNPQMVEMLRELGERVGAEYAFCFVILCIKPGTKT